MATIPATRFAVRGLTHDLTTYVREHGRDPVWGHPTLTEAATGFGPCRHCLRTFRTGELRTLFTHDTYAGVAEHPQPGPVYIHAEECPRYESEGFPPALRALKLTFEAVVQGPRVIALARTEGVEVEQTIVRLLDQPDVEFLNVRNTEAGCFVARIERHPDPRLEREEDVEQRDG